MEEKETFVEKKSGSVYKALEKAREEEEEKKRKKPSLLQTVVYFGLPLASVGVFLGILTIGTIPSIQKISDNRGVLNEKKEEIQDLDRQIEALKRLKTREAEMDADLSIIDRIVPSAKTQVAMFVGEIDTLAKDHSLVESSYEAGEEIEKLEEEIEEQAESDVAIINIPTTSEYVAAFEAIESFLNALYQKKDFIIVRELDMQGHLAREYLAALQRAEGRQVTVDTTLAITEWTMAVTFEKYQFSKGFTEYISENFVSINSEPDESTLEYIRDRYH